MNQDDWAEEPSLETMANQMKKFKLPEAQDTPELVETNELYDVLRHAPDDVWAIEDPEERAQAIQDLKEETFKILTLTTGMVMYEGITCSLCSTELELYADCQCGIDTQAVAIYLCQDRLPCRARAMAKAMSIATSDLGMGL